MKKFFGSKVQGQLRHLMTFLGPVLSVFLVSEDPVALIENLMKIENAVALVGLVVAVGGFLASWFAPEKKAASE